MNEEILRCQSGIAGEIMQDDTMLIKYFEERIQHCNSLVVKSKEALANTIDNDELPIEEWIKNRNEQMGCEDCFNHLQKHFIVLEPLFRDLGYSDEALKYIGDMIRTAAKQ